jgi:CubicO group peptidase (beta-lactamase class C family)
MLKKLLIWVLVTGVFASVLVTGFAPQLPALFVEGFPAPVWPSKGRFAQVTGTEAVAADLSSLSETAIKRLGKAEGRVLLVDQAGQDLRGVYLAGTSPETLLNSYSLVKSLVGVMVLRAVADGLLTLDTPIRERLGAEAPDLSLRELLTMTSGLALVGDFPKEEHSKSTSDGRFSPFGPVGRLHVYGVTPLLSDLRPDPVLRGAFHYQSVNTALLGLILERAYGLPLEQLLSEMIWQPAGAGHAQWRQYSRQDRVSAYCCLYARAEDWLKVGRYLLNNGSAEQPFLPDGLWRDWVLPDLPAHERRRGHYGWQIRHDVLDRAGASAQGGFAYMMGHGGQMVYLLSEQDAVVVRFGAQPQLLHSTLYELFD